MKKEIKYTDSGRRKLELTIQKLKERIEKDITKAKNYPGEDFIEITASDIEAIYDRIEFRRRYSKTSSRNRMFKQVLPIYFAIGIVMMVYGLFYDNIQSILTENSGRVGIILGGFIFSLFSAVLYTTLKQREVDNRKDFIKYKLEQEKELLELKIQQEELLRKLLNKEKNKDDKASA